MTQDPDELAMVEVVVTCHTEACGNAGAGILLTVPADPSPPNVVCGVCGQPITDVAEAPPVPQQEEAT